ncbi:hypothetical protein [Dactylosporangium sp. NPDC049140]|uniref:hypothetical protein n=1 Tax=Dactylosporangium sp. NPDC049140 TaxID=3155647 RepID=UPI0033EC64E1
MRNPAFADLLDVPVNEALSSRVVYVRCAHGLTGPYGAVVESIVDTLDRHGLVVRLGRGPLPDGVDPCGAILIGDAEPVPYPYVVVGDEPPPDGVAGVWSDRAAARRLLAEHRPAAVVCADAGQAAEERRRGAEVAVLDDTGVVGGDMVAVRRSWGEVGALAAAVLLRLLDGAGGEPPRVAVPPELA